MTSPKDAPLDQLDPDDTGEIELPAALAGAVGVARRRWEAEEALDEALIASMDVDLRALEPADRDALLQKITRLMGKRRPGRPRLDVPAPLWALLRRRTFDRLPVEAHETLWLIATSTDPARATLAPLAAIAAIALWLHAPERLHEAARELLKAQPLPTDGVWLHMLAREITNDLGADGELLVLTLARMQRAAGFMHGACWIAAVGLLVAEDRWLSGPLEAALERVCDRVAAGSWARRAAWIELMAQAGHAAKLLYSWLERVVDAALRLRVGRADEQTRALRTWHETRPYEASDRRIIGLYAHLLRPDQSAELVRALDRIEPYNALRAQRLLEVWAMLRLMPRHPGPRGRRLSSALTRLSQLHGALSLRLARLYVENASIGREEAAHVRRHVAQLEAEHETRRALSDYLLMSDYVGAFTSMRCDLAGISMHHADKHAASRVAYFLERRDDSQRVVHALERGLAAWPQDGMPGLEVSAQVVDRALALAHDWVGGRDGAASAVAALREAGAPIMRFEQIADCPLDTIEAALQGITTRRLFVGVSGGMVTGALATVGPPSMALADLPLLLVVCVDTCARICWLYGFDPRLHPQLPFEILAAALEGAHAKPRSPQELHRALRRLLLGRGAALASLRGDPRAQASGIFRRLAASAALPLLEGSLGPRQVQRARSALRTLLATERPGGAVLGRLRPRRILPMAGAALGAALGATLLYDVCEAAQIVLTDRFLARKYPEWPRHL